MIIEFHDCNATAEGPGTFFAGAGHRSPIKHNHQLEEHIRKLFGDNDRTRRAYVLGPDGVCAIYAKTPDATIYYVARTNSFTGAWQLPFLYPNATRVLTFTLGKEIENEVLTWAEAELWAREHLRGNVSSVVLLDHDGLCAAWEKIEGIATLVAKNPRPVAELQTA